MLSIKSTGQHQRANRFLPTDLSEDPIFMGILTKTLLTITALSVFCMFAGLYAQAGDMLLCDTHKRFGDCVATFEQAKKYKYQFIKVNSYGDWSEVRVGAKQQGLEEVEMAVGIVKKGEMAGTGFVVESGAPERRDFEITYNSNVAVRFSGELRGAVREAGKFNSFAEFQAEMRRRKWQVTSARYGMEG